MPGFQLFGFSSFDGVYDITSGLLDLAENTSVVFTPLQLTLIASTVRSAKGMHDLLEKQQALVPLLRIKSIPIGNVDSKLVSEIEICIRARGQILSQWVQ